MDSRFAELRGEAQSIRAQGRWVSGHADLLGILRRDRDELFHSRILGWLLTPTGRHGLGDRFLRAFLSAVAPDVQLADDLGLVTIDLERTAIGESGVTGELLESRADLVIRIEGLLVVVENKLDAGEQPRQCERLYWSWVQQNTEVRWVFLTPNGRPPSSASGEVLAEFRSLSYRIVRDALDFAIREAPAAIDELGRGAVLQYLATLNSHVSPHLGRPQ